MNKKKALEEAKSWIHDYLMFAIYDCSDSMHYAETSKDRFDAFVEDTIDISDFVEKNLMNEYLEELAEFSKDEDADLKNTPSQLPIPYEKTEKKLKAWIKKHEGKNN